MSRIAVGISSPAGPSAGLFSGLLRFGRVVGLDSFLLWDHLQDFTPRAVWRSPGFSWMADKQESPHSQAEPFAMLAHLARSAGRIRLGVGVTDTLRHHPVSVARSIITLATMTRSAPILGVGAGERMSTEPYGISFDHPVGRFEEAVRILRRCLDEPGSIDFAGDFYTLDRAPFDLTAPKGKKPEIWVAAQGPRMLQIAGKYADGWLPAFGPSPGHYESGLRRLRESALAAGRPQDAITPSLQIGMVVAPTREEARVALRSRNVRFHAVTSASPQAWREAGLEHPLGAAYRGFVDVIPENLDPAQLEEAMAAVPDEVLQQTNLWGTIDDIVASIRDLGDAGLRHISLIPASYPVNKKLANYTWRALPGIIRRLR